jgi:hypothetical protein
VHPTVHPTGQTHKTEIARMGLSPNLRWLWVKFDDTAENLDGFAARRSMQTTLAILEPRNQ